MSMDANAIPLTLLLAQTRRALGAGEQQEGVEQVDQHGGEHGRVDEPESAAASSASVWLTGLSRRYRVTERATSRTTTASQITRLVPNSHREPRRLSAVARASPGTTRDSSTIAANIPNTAQDQVQEPGGPRETLDLPVSVGRLAVRRAWSRDLRDAQGVSGLHGASSPGMIILDGVR